MNLDTRQKNTLITARFPGLIAHDYYHSNKVDCNYQYYYISNYIVGKYTSIHQEQPFYQFI